MVKQKPPSDMKTSRALSQFVSVVKVSVGTVELAKSLGNGSWRILSLSEHLQDELGRCWEDFGQ